MIVLNLVMCDKKCKHQEDGYCKVKECSLNSLSESCPHFEEKSGVTIEFPHREPIEEVPTLKPDLPIQPQQRPL